MITPSPSINFLQYPPLYLEQELAIGNRLIILAESEEGDFYHPTIVSNQEMVQELFGYGPLLQCYLDACTYQSNLTVYLMRMEPYAFEEAFTVLESFDFDLLYIHDMHFDIHTSSIENFLDFAKTKEAKGNLIHGITTLSPDKTYEDMLLLEPSIKALSKETGDDNIESGKYLSLVFPQGAYQNAGAIYAGMLVSIEPQVSPINKTIPSFELGLAFTKEQILHLRSMGIVCFKETLKKGVTCTSSSCAVSTEGSVHKHISNFRIAQYLINQISLELQPFIGKPHIAFQSNHVEEIVNAICLDFIYLERIKAYDYSLSVRELEGIIDLGIELVPIFSVHKLTTHSRVRVFK